MRIAGIGRCGPGADEGLDLPADEARRLATQSGWSLKPFIEPKSEPKPKNKKIVKVVHDA